MTLRRLKFWYRALLKDLKAAPSMSSPVFKRKLRLTARIARRIIEAERALAEKKRKI